MQAAMLAGGRSEDSVAGVEFAEPFVPNAATRLGVGKSGQLLAGRLLDSKGVVFELATGHNAGDSAAVGGHSCVGFLLEKWDRTHTLVQTPWELP